MKFTKSHEWLQIEGNIATVGITDYAQNALGDLVFVDIKEVGDTLSVGDTLAEVESVKAVSEVFSPVGGTIVEINSEIVDNPALINEDAYGAWFAKIEFTDTDELLSQDEYDAICD